MLSKTPLPVWQAAPLIGVVVFVINLVIARVMASVLNAPATFAPLTPMPVLGASLGGVLLASCVYFWMTRSLPKPLPAIYAVSGVVLLLSFILPIRLFRTSPPPSPRFQGITVPIAATMILMHTLVAAGSLVAFRLWHDNRGAGEQSVG